MRVRVTTEFEIDPVEWIAAAEDAEYLAKGEIDPTDLELVANYATGYCDAEDHLPRWARDAMRVTAVLTEVRSQSCINCGNVECYCGGDDK